MTRPMSLPDSCMVPVATRRLAHPELLWQDDGARALGFDPEQVYCSPVSGDPPEAYTDEVRLEWADRYGGIGVATAGGSGRCASFGMLQTKGVGVTPLVAPDGDEHHSSGTQSIFSALAEALFAPVFAAALPYGAVPTLALMLPYRPGRERMSVARALTIRPFALRPAHFVRNLLNAEQRQPQGPDAPGLTRDAYRVRQAMTRLADGLMDALGIETPPAMEAESIDLGLREVGRRLACQVAAGFAKRLPHGSMSCSNIALDGRYMDFGLSRFLPAYRRPADALQDPWAEGVQALTTLTLLRQQLDKYRPSLRGSKIVSPEELARLFSADFEQRLSTEMARMGGLTEDLVALCPAECIREWASAMRSICGIGAAERHGMPTAVEMRRLPDLNRILSLSAGHGDPGAMDNAIRSELPDARLRERFVRTATAVRANLHRQMPDAGPALDAYLSAQAKRKNALLDGLDRGDWFRISVVIRIQEEDFSGSAVARHLSTAIAHARHTLSDLAPQWPGNSGAAQIEALARQTDRSAMQVDLALSPNLG
jgi:hypothetical protein